MLQPRTLPRATRPRPRTLLGLSSVPVGFLSLVLGVLLALVVLPAESASAQTTLLCKGFSGCASAGYSSSGYSSNYQKMWWRMYSGHNCTNYAAYRMVKAGLSPERPWSGSGNASNWGVALASKTNKTPMVGAVAWWQSRNHVQYVEKVIDANTIIISEDHWGGDFDWARVTRSDSNWPTGFIHLADVRIANTALPTISGTPQVDQPLVATRGSWSQSGTSVYQWLANGVSIPGATSATFTPTPAQVGKAVSVRVTTSRMGYLPGKAWSARTAAVAPGDFTVQQVPTISGLAKVNSTLTATTGSWTPAATSTTVQWLADGTPVPGATAWTLKLGADQLNKVVTVRVTAQRAGYDPGPATSAGTAPVGPENIQITEPAKLSGRTRYGGTLTVSPGTYSPSDSRFSVAWLRDGVPISGATALGYTTQAADLGHRVTARVSYTKPGYRTIVRVLDPGRDVQDRPTLAIASPSTRVVQIKVTNPRVAPVTGQVRLVSYDGHSAVRWLSNGRTYVTATWIHSGTARFTVQYLGSAPIEPGQRLFWLAVR